MGGMSIIPKTITRLLFPFVALFGAYIVVHGHLSPGGGFPGGVIVASAFIMIAVAYGVEGLKKEKRVIRAEILESIGGLAIVIFGMLGIAIGLSFLQNVFPTGQLGELFSGGILPFLYLGVGLKVAAGILLVFYSMLFGFEGED